MGEPTRGSAMTAHVEGAQRGRLRMLQVLSLAGVLFTVAVILVGVFTRLVDAGLGCPDWPGCYGRLVVPDESRALAHTPEAPLEAFKAWVEMVHRYVASALGLLVIALVLLGAPLRRRADYPWGVSLALLAVILVQGAFGAFTVTLKLWPQVVTLHLLGGLSVALLVLGRRGGRRRSGGGRGARGGGGAPGRPRRRLGGRAGALRGGRLPPGGGVPRN